jgi:hypothetical protein
LHVKLCSSYNQTPVNRLELKKKASESKYYIKLLYIHWFNQKSKLMEKDRQFIYTSTDIALVLSFALVIVGFLSLPTSISAGRTYCTA